MKNPKKTQKTLKNPANLQKPSKTVKNLEKNQKSLKKLNKTFEKPLEKQTVKSHVSVIWVSSPGLYKI